MWIIIHVFSVWAHGRAVTTRLPARKPTGAQTCRSIPGAKWESSAPNDEEKVKKASKIHEKQNVDNSWILDAFFQVLVAGLWVLGTATEY